MPPSWATASSNASHRGPDGVLTLVSEGSLNRAQEQPSIFGKQKPEMNLNALESLLKTTIAVKPYPPNALSKSYSLQPLMLLPREESSLAFIDFSDPHGDLSSSRFYESHVKILDLEERMVAKSSILIARADNSKMVYMLEKNDRGLFTVCKLGSWVSIAELALKATVSIAQLAEISDATSREYRPRPLTTPHLHNEHKEKRLAIEALQSAVRKRGRSQSVSAFDEAIRPDKRPRSRDDTSPPPPTQNSTPGLEPRIFSPEVTHTTSGETQTIPPVTGTQVDDGHKLELIFDNIRCQYMDALYRSKGSLAYFAKGPMSRARAAFLLDSESTLNMNDLVNFLKSLVMTTVQIDKKYRETVPDIMSKLKTLVETSDEGTRAKKRRPRKMKLSKNGLYPQEESQISKWWIANRPDPSGDETSIPPALIKSHVDLLRTRETQLQIIIILEILALEPLQPREGDSESQLAGLGDGPVDQKPMPAQPTKKRNKHNLPILVDVHADRLCIWQSTASDEFRLLEDSQGLISHSANGPSAGKASADPLKDFCTDIIMPFFAARLPELCDSINRKLGGPVIVSPPKPQRVKPSSSKAEARPGAATKRPAPILKPKTIERALNKEQSRRSVSRGPASAIALLRSATSSIIPGLKREASESSLLRDMAGAERDTAERPRLLSRSSSSTVKDDAKAQKKALVDAQLKDAISILRRPNRELAGKSIMEAAERRTSGGLSHTRKSKKPTRHPLFEGVQVKATPANNRFRDALAGESLEGSAIPPSSASVIPGTVRRSNSKDFLNAGPSSIIRETPSKRVVPKQPATDEESAIPPSSPLMMRKPSRSTVTANHSSRPPPPPPRYGAPRSPSPSGMRRIFATPVKTKTSLIALEDEEDEIAATPMAKAAPVTKTKSIFERLGWDDEFDDL